MKKLISISIIFFLSAITVHAQESPNETSIIKQDEKIKIALKKSDSVIVFLDGKKVDPSIIELLDANKIKSVDVLKGKQAMKKYDSPNVILIESIKETEKVSIIAQGNKIIIRNKDGGTESPVIIVDGEVKDEDYLQKISADDIHKISIFKDEEHKKKYHNEYGVIMVTTKKQAKKEGKGKE